MLAALELGQGTSRRLSVIAGCCDTTTTPSGPAAGKPVALCHRLLGQAKEAADTFAECDALASKLASPRRWWCFQPAYPTIAEAQAAMFGAAGARSGAARGTGDAVAGRGKLGTAGAVAQAQQELGESGERRRSVASAEPAQSAPRSPSGSLIREELAKVLRKPGQDQGASRRARCFEGVPCGDRLPGGLDAALGQLDQDTRASATWSPAASAWPQQRDFRHRAASRQSEHRQRWRHRRCAR